jgi:hypothetical protein
LLKPKALEFFLKPWNLLTRKSKNKEKKIKTKTNPTNTAKTLFKTFFKHSNTLKQTQITLKYTQNTF